MSNSNTYTLKYRTFNSLFEDVSVDFKNFTSQGDVNPQSLIKVARKCNYDLGFRIYKTRQIVLEVEHSQVRLPDDFHILNFATMCGEFETTVALPQGTEVEERLIVPQYTPDPGQPDTCGNIKPDPCPVLPEDPCTKVCLTECGDEFELVQKIKTTKRTYRNMRPLHIVDHEKIQCDCPNTSQWQGFPDQARIENGFLKTNFKTGKVYLNYQGDMIDDDGNVLVPDHEMINEYYEYSLKERILEDLLMNGSDVSTQYGLIAQKLRASRNYALSIVNTPNWNEMKKLWEVNRKAQYSNYYDMFKSHWPLSYKRYGYQR